MLSWQEQARGPGKGEGAGCLPTRPGSVKGLGTCVSRQQLQLPPTSQVGLWTLPSRLPCPTSLFLPQFCSFGSTDGIKTAVSVGPQRDGIVASVPEEHACLPHRSESPACHFHRTQESVEPPHPLSCFLLLSYPSPDTLMFPGWSQVSRPLPCAVSESSLLTCPFPWSWEIQTPPGPVPGISQISLVLNKQALC